MSVDPAASSGRRWPRPVGSGLAVSALLTAVVAGGVASVSWVAGYSLLLGGLASLVPNALFASRVFAARGGGHDGHDDDGNGVDPGSSMEVGALVRAEIGKLVTAVVAVLLVAVLVMPLSLVALVGGFVLTHLACSVTALALSAKPR